METKSDLIKYSVTDAAIKQLQDEFLPLTVKGVDDKAGYEICHKAQMKVRDLRIEVENKRKELKADALEYGRKVDSEAKRITEQLEVVENHLKAQKQIVDDEKKRLKEEEERRERAEQERRVSMLQSVKATFQLAEIALMSSEAFESLYWAKKAEFDASEKKRLDDEKRLAELEAQAKADRERLAAIEAENKRLQDEAIAAKNREIAEKEAQLRKEREAHEAAENARQEEKAAEERKWREERAKEQLKLQEEADERKRIEDERLEKERKEKEEAEAKRKKDEEEARAKAADKKLFDTVKTEFPTIEAAWVEIVRLRKTSSRK